MRFAVLVAALGWVSSELAKWRNTTVGIHAFLTFDSFARPDDIADFGDQIDFVWGASGKNLKAWGSSNPEVVLSKYIPFTRDPSGPAHTTGTGPNATALPWWQANHPELVLYRCDRKTPAWECFVGEGCKHVSIPLDLTNPDTLDYQMQAAVLPAAQAGYNAIALDNYGLQNTWSACGAYSGPNRTWVQLYGVNETDPSRDARYTADVLDWTKRAVQAIHGVGLLVIPNFSEMDFQPETLAATNLTDGILAEAGFTMWNPRPNTSSFTTPPLKTTPKKFAAQVAFIRNLQRHGKGFFAINEWGAGPDFGLNPGEQPHNISGDSPGARAIRQFVAAAFMTVNGGSCGVFLTCIQCYGGKSGGRGNFSVWPEYSAAVGYPLGEPRIVDPNTGVWAREYSASIALVNPAATHQSAALPALKKSRWMDLYGNPVNQTSVVLEPASGMVLLRINGA